jgi:hypothetical protein
MNQIFCWHKYKAIDWGNIKHLWEGHKYRETCHIIYKCEKCEKVKKGKDLPWMSDEKMDNLIK